MTFGHRKEERIMNKTKKLLSVSILSFVCAIFVALAVVFSAPVKSAFASSDVFYLDNGAYIRVDSEETSGLRFRANIDKAYYDALKTDYPSVDAGMIIVPSDYVELAGNATLNALNAYATTNSTDDNQITIGMQDCNNEFKNILDADEQVTTYGYSLTLSKVLDKNYAREMTGIGYIKLPQSEVEAKSLSGDSVQITANEVEKTAILYDGNYYIYTATNITRSVYETAYNAYTAETNGNRGAIVKAYIDGVVDITYADGEATIANNKEGDKGYTSPYTVEKDANGDFKVSKSTNASAKSILLNDSVEDYPVVCGGKNLYVMQSETQAVLGADNSVTMPTNYIENYNIDNIKTYNQSYVAFEGKYDVGTYLSVTFTGNNMPYVMFFANNINGKIANKYDSTSQTWENDDKGVLFTNGFLSKQNSSWTEKPNMAVGMSVFGPNKLDISLTNAAAPKTVQTNANNNWWDPIQMDKLFAATTDVTYTLVIGTEMVDGVLNVVEHLYVQQFGGAAVASGSNVKPKYNWVCSNSTAVEGRGTSITADDIEAGNIILIAPMTGDGENLTVAGCTQGTCNFTYTAPQKGVFTPKMATVQIKGTVPDAQGNIHLDSDSWQAAGYSWNQWGSAARHTTIMGDYGVGTYMDFEFTGKTLPQVMLFGKVETGDEANIANFSRYGNGTSSDTSTLYNRQGVIIINTASDNGGGTGISNGLQVYGPNRIGGRNLTFENGGADPRFSSDQAAIAKGTDLDINHYNLEDGVKYKYTLGTCLAQDGTTVLLDYKLVKIADGTVVAEEKLTLTGVDKAITGYITIKTPFVYNNGEYKDIKISMPYTK